MTLPTTRVVGTIYNPDGTPARNVKGTARLTHYEADDGVVVPSLVAIETDESGALEIDLWPNARGQAGSQYRVEIAQGRRLLLNVLIAVPESESPVPIESIINHVPYPPVDQAQQAVAQAQSAALEAKGYRDEASNKADAFASQLATMSAQILAIQNVVAEHHGFGE